MRFLVWLRIIAAFLLFKTSLAWGWGSLGHQTVGEIAERHLTDKGKALVFQILGTEPLAMAGIFADYVRPDKYFDFMAPYHYLQVPIGKSAKAAIEADWNKETADAFVRNPNFLTDRKMNRDAKMVFLRYLVHIVGDVHQPLHVGNGIDFLAVYCWVKWTNPENHLVTEETLHHVWDDLIPDYYCFDYYKSHPDEKAHWGCNYRVFADTILSEFNALAVPQRESIVQASSFDRLKWYEEDQALFPLVYPDKEASQSPETRPYCKRKEADGKITNAAYDESKLPLLDEKYVKRSVEIAKSQILKAGLRLAWIINKAAEAGRVRPLRKDEKQKVMDRLHLEKYSLLPSQ